MNTPQNRRRILRELSPDALLVLNPAANGHRTRKLLAALEAGGLPSSRVLVSERPGHIEHHLARLRSVPRRILVAGGDGTLHEAVNGLERCAARPEIVLVGTGTGNSLHRALAEAVDEAYDLDLVRAELCLDSGDRIVRHVAACAGFGHVAELAALANARYKLLGRRWTYPIATLLRSVRPARRRVEIDRREIADVTMGLIHNVPWTANFRLSPESRPDDGHAELMLACDFGFARTARLALQGLLGHRPNLPGLQSDRFTRRRLTFERPTAVHLDGEVTDSVVELGLTVLAHRFRVRAIESRTFTPRRDARLDRPSPSRHTGHPARAVTNVTAG